MSFRTGIFFTALSAFALAGAPAWAQDATTWQLPPSQTQKPTAQGPVVPDAPPPRVSTTPLPAPTIAAPTPSPTSSSTASPTPAPTARAQSRPEVQRQPVAVPSPKVEVEPDAGPSTFAIPLPTAAGPPAPSPTGATESPVLASDEDDGGEVPLWAWLAGAVVLLLTGFMVGRRGRKPSEEVEFEPPVRREDSPDPARKLVTEPVPVAFAAPLVVDLVASRMSASLVNATLAYRLRIVAQEAISALAVRGGMTSAHASRPAEELLGAGDSPVLHKLAGMAAGESVEIDGEIRLPLSEITPIRHGTAAMFVPLVRIEITGIAGHRSLSVRSAFVVGIEDGAGDARLQPFRLDHGPRIYARVGQRELVVPSFA